MARYIDTETIVNKLEELTIANEITQRQDDVTKAYKKVHKGMATAYNHCRNIILDTPTADVEEVKHGHWITDEKGIVICSECGEEHAWDEYRATYCEDCGAKMDGGKE